MTADEEQSLIRIEQTRRVNRRAAAKCADMGVSDEELAFAAIYSAVDLCQHQAGNPIAAIEWVRRTLDMMEANAPVTSETVQ